MVNSCRTFDRNCLNTINLLKEPDGHMKDRGSKVRGRVYDAAECVKKSIRALFENPVLC